MDFDKAELARANALDTLIRCAESVADAGDYGDMLGAVRLVELAAEQARRAIVVEAVADGAGGQVREALGLTGEQIETRFLSRP